VANPNETPILIEAVGRITFGYGYGRFGVFGGYPNDGSPSALGCDIAGKSVLAAGLFSASLQDILLDTLLKSPEDDIAFLVLLDGPVVRAKVWNPGSQPEPPDWQLTAELKTVKYGSALVLETNIGGYWDHVNVWKVKKE
jgi:hypothetical protein